MNDTISRQVAIDALTDKNIIEHMDSVYDSELHRFKRATERIIAQLPSAQPERKRGKWIYYPKASGSVKSTAVHLYPVCSECGCEHPIANYCPNCGADMREGGE